MHHCQDFVLAISILVFNAALVPTVLGKSKPALTTSVLTTVFMVATVVVYISLSLWYTTLMSAINALLWGTLALQKLKSPPIKNRKR
jgi:hypothetical protein